MSLYPRFCRAGIARVTITFLFPILVSLIAPVPPACDAQGGLSIFRRQGGIGFPTPAAPSPAEADTPPELHYAPDRDVNIRHVALDITPDFKRRTIAGKAAIQFQPLSRPTGELHLDAVDLDVHSVTSSEKIRGFQTSDNELIITFENPVPPGKETEVIVDYSAEPTKGLYFRTPEMGYKAGDTHLFTQGEAIEARHWYPCYDAPNQKFTSEITCRVPQGMTVLSNGRLVSQEKDPMTGLMVVHWSQEKPQSSYLLSLAAGYFKGIEDKYQGKSHTVPLAFYTPASEFKEAANSFRDTRNIIGFFEDEIGVPYPWAKYYQVCVNDFVAGGMENTSMTTLTDNTLFTDATESLHDSDDLVSHEMAHQWFGDLVTCKDWSQIWLNEGFATYYAHLYEGHKNGRDKMLYGLYRDARSLQSRVNDTRPIVDRRYNEPMEEFSSLAYAKGGWVLHMLRSQLGDDLYRRCIQTYLQRHEFGNVTTDDLDSVIEELSGRSFDQFFDQWVYHAHYPELEASFNWDARAKLARVSIRQVQAVNDNVLLFNFPLTIRFKSGAGSVDKQIVVKQRSEDFYLPLQDAPEIVRLDPEYTVLAKITFPVPAPMLRAQLLDKGDMMGRLLAVDQLGQRQDHAAIDQLKQALNTDTFYGVRVEAARALQSIHNDESCDALVASLNQPDARVRDSVVQAIGGFYKEAAYAADQKVLADEKNPGIQADAIRSLGPYGKSDVREVLLRYLRSSSYRNGLAVAAIGAIQDQDDPVYVQPLLEVLKTREPEFTTIGFVRGLSTLAYLDRREEKKDAIREFLMGYLNSPNPRIRRSAITALGVLQDPRAIAALMTFSQADRDNPDRQAAEAAVTSLQNAEKPSDDLRELRTEVLDLQRANRDLKQQMDDIKKRLDASPGPEDKRQRETGSPAVQ